MFFVDDFSFSVFQQFCVIPDLFWLFRLAKFSMVNVANYFKRSPSSSLEKVSQTLFLLFCVLCVFFSVYAS